LLQGSHQTPLAGLVAVGIQFPPPEALPPFLGLLQRSMAHLCDPVEQGVTIALTLDHEISGALFIVNGSLFYVINFTYLMV
jgi:hypothetical protein